MVLIQIFSGEKPEELVLDKRAAYRAAELLASKARRGLPPIEGGRQSLEILVAEKKVLPTMDAIGAGLCRDVDDARRGAPDFRGKFGGNLKLGQTVFREIHQGAADHFVIVVGAVDNDVAASSIG